MEQRLEWALVLDGIVIFQKLSLPLSLPSVVLGPR